MDSLLFGLLRNVLVDPFFDYFLHGITLGRILTRVVSAVFLFAGIYLAFFQPAPLSYAGWALSLLAGMFVLYDTLTVNRHTRR